MKMKDSRIHEIALNPDDPILIQSCLKYMDEFCSSKYFCHNDITQKISLIDKKDWAES
jgi:hypothetical protein